MKRAMAGVVALAAALAAPAATGAQGRKIDPAVAAVEHWIDAVERHTPGRSDAALAFVWHLDRGTYTNLVSGLKDLLPALGDQPPAPDPPDGRAIDLADPPVTIAALAHDVVRHVGVNPLLERAALLHADAVIFADSPPQSFPPPVPSDTTLYSMSDGELTGHEAADWNLPFARWVLDAIAPKPAADPFVANWYHATAALLLAHGQLGEAGPHLTKADALFPDDARIQFDRACLAEALGLPLIQDVLSERDVVYARIRDSGRFPTAQQIGGTTAPVVSVPPADVTDREAERLFRRVIELNPEMTEARVRLARVLEERGDNNGALDELRKAAARPASREVVYYEDLFAARADRAIGKLDEAATRAAQALTLFPGAQSGLLASSQIALLRADRAGALAPIARLAALPRDRQRRADPWWQYIFGPGRDARSLFEAIWAEK